MVIEGACVTVAMYCLIQFFIQLRSDLVAHKPLLKIVAIKLVVFLSFWQTVSRSSTNLSTCPILLKSYSSSFPLSPPAASSNHRLASKHLMFESAFLPCFSALKWQYLVSFTFGHFRGKFTTCGVLKSWLQNPPQVSFQIQRPLIVVAVLAAKLSWTLSILGT